MTETTKQPTSQNAAERGPYSVVVVDDHAMFRTGVKAEIGRLGGRGGRGRRRRPGHSGHPADPSRRGAAGRAPARRRWRRGHAARCTTRTPEQKFLALSVSDAAEDVIGVIRAGARGYVTKSISGPELIDAIRRVAEGDAVFSPRLAGFVLDAFSGAIDIATRR